MSEAEKSSWFAWAAGRLDAGPVVDWRGLRDGGSPWLLTMRGDGSPTAQTAVLRVGEPGDTAAVEREAVALEAATAAGVPAPNVLAVRTDGDRPLLLISAIDAASTIPAESRTVRLRALGRAAARIHTVPAPRGLPRRTRPIETVDFAALRRLSEPDPLLRKAEEAMASTEPTSASGFVHGDLWQGNVLWKRDKVAAIIDWDCAGVGPAGVDFGSLRCDAALCYGMPAADEVLAGWQEEAGRAPDDVAYWDVVAALSTPPDLGWFVAAIGGQGRSDLSRDDLRERRDEYLDAALRHL